MLDQGCLSPSEFPVNTHGGLLGMGAPWEVEAQKNACMMSALQSGYYELTLLYAMWFFRYQHFSPLSRRVSNLLRKVIKARILECSLKVLASVLQFMATEEFSGQAQSPS